MSRSKSDTSVNARPIELGRSLNDQLLDARATASREVIDYLENDCDVILECRMCRSLFRSLANFISHKRIFCQGRFQLQRDAATLARHAAVTVVMPEDVDETSKDRVTNSTSDARRSLGGPRNKPARKPISLVQAVMSQSQARKNVSLQPIQGVSTAVTQAVVKHDPNIPPEVMNGNNNIAVVKPKDGYPNMNLRERTTKEGKISMEDYIDFYDDDNGDEIPTVIREARDTSPPPTAAGSSSPLSAAEKHPYCDLVRLRCTHCKFSYSSARSLKVHITNYHGNTKKIWVCPLCKTFFCQYWGVSRHLRRLHGISDSEMASMKRKIKYKIIPHDATTKSKQSGKEGEGELQMQPITASGPTADHTAKTSEAKRSVALPHNYPYRCNFCTKVFSKEAHLRLHKQACSKKAATVVSKRREASTLVPNLFVCKECNCAFDQKEKKDAHTCSKKAVVRLSFTPTPSVDSDTEGKIKRHSCDVCQRRFTMVQNMKQHRAACLRRHGLPADEYADSDAEKQEPKAETSRKVEKKPVKDTVTVLKQEEQVLEVQSAEESENAPDSPLAQNRPKRNIKPKKFHDGTKAPDVVKVQQADGSMCYKLREDVISQTTKQIKSEVPKPTEPPRPRDGRVTRKQFQGDIIPKLDDEREEKLSALINTDSLTCNQPGCTKQYPDMASLRRHAVRHLGWERYKCKMCEYTTPDKVECKGHLRDRHPRDVSTLLDSGLQEYILDIGEDETEEEKALKLSVETSTPSQSSQPSPKQPVPSPKRGRPSSAQLKVDTSTPKSGSGSSLKVSPSVSSQSPKQPPIEKRGKGRPRKYPRPSAVATESDLNDSQDDSNLSVSRSADENKRKSSSVTSSSPAKVTRQDNSSQSGAKQSKLEFLLTKIRSRKPLTSDSNGAVNSEQSKSTTRESASK